MTKTRSMTRNQNYDNDDASSSSKKRFKTFENGDLASWSGVNHDVLFIVMMQLGLIDFIVFSGVCKSRRSFALSNRNMFMVSKPPLKICIQPDDPYFYLNDFEGRNLKTIIPHSDGRTCFGLTCGYFILFSRERRDFWLVNPITMHELHFLHYPTYVGAYEDRLKPILVFSPSISGWVFILPNTKVSICIAGKRGWNHVSTTVPIIDLRVFKGKIYTLHKDCSIGELIINPKSKWKGKWTLLETKSVLEPVLYYGPRLVSSHDSLYLINWSCRPKKVMELDFKEMKWVSPEQTIEEYEILVSYFNSCVAIKPESWAGHLTQKYKSNGQILDTGESRKCVFCYEGSWYFPHECLHVNLLDER